MNPEQYLTERNLLGQSTFHAEKGRLKLNKLELITNSIQRRLESSGETEIPTKVIGELVMDALKELDEWLT